MKVEIVAKSSDPTGAVSRAAGLCYGKDDKNFNRIVNCYKAGHTSVLEHASVTFKVEGVSRACSHQLVRHRLASYCQESQRYNKYSLDGDDWYVVPQSFESNAYELAKFNDSMLQQAEYYRSALRAGMKPEDARYLLPEATKTSLAVTMNLRSLFHFFDLRLGKKAQWEIRELAWQMFYRLQEDEEFAYFAELYLTFRENTRID